jgi:hypothetical protein
MIRRTQTCVMVHAFVPKLVVIDERPHGLSLDRGDDACDECGRPFTDPVHTDEASTERRIK